MAYVYVMEVGDTCKIGITNCVEGRIKQIQTGCPYKIERVWSTATRNANLCEKILHLVFQDVNTSGEWFKVPFDDASEIAQYVCNSSASVESIYMIVKFLAQKSKALIEENNDLRNKCAFYEKELQEKAGSTQREENSTKKIGKVFYSIADASTALGLSQYFLRQLVKQDKIPFINSGVKYYINVPECMDLMMKGELK